MYMHTCIHIHAQTLIRMNKHIHKPYICICFCIYTYIYAYKYT